MREITGRLEGWRRDDVYNVIWGYCFDDIHNRWRDGTWIHTSSIKGLKKMKLKEGDEVQTLNSLYLLGKPFSEEAIEGLISDLEKYNNENYRS